MVNRGDDGFDVVDGIIVVVILSQYLVVAVVVVVVGYVPWG